MGLILGSGWITTVRDLNRRTRAAFNHATSPPACTHTAWSFLLVLSYSWSGEKVGNRQRPKNFPLPALILGSDVCLMERWTLLISLLSYPRLITCREVTVLWSLFAVTRFWSEFLLRNLLPPVKALLMQMRSLFGLWKMCQGFPRS